MTNVAYSDHHKGLSPDFQLTVLAFTAHSVAVAVHSHQPQQAALINPQYTTQHQTADDQHQRQ